MGSVRAVGKLVHQKRVDTAGNRRGTLPEQDAQQPAVEEARSSNTFVWKSRLERRSTLGFVILGRGHRINLRLATDFPALPGNIHRFLAEAMAPIASFFGQLVRVSGQID